MGSGWNKKLLVYFKGGKTFGTTRVWPRNDIAEFFCEITGKKCIAEDILDRLTKYGFTIEYYGQRCPFLDKRFAIYREDLNISEQEQEIVEE